MSFLSEEVDKEDLSAASLELSTAVRLAKEQSDSLDDKELVVRITLISLASASLRTNGNR
jgi:hypothetical protein